MIIGNSFSAHQAGVRSATRRSILGEEDKLFFLDIPETNGSIISERLVNFFDQTEICPAHSISQLAEIQSAELITYRFFPGFIAYDELIQVLPTKPKSFTFLRDPIAHAVATFQHLQAIPNGMPGSPVQHISLAEYIRNPGQNDYRNRQTRFLTAATRHDFTTMSSASPEDLEIGGLLADFEFVGLTERLEDSLNLLTYSFGWRPFTQFPASNSAQPVLPPHLIQLIREQSLLDCKLHAFASQLFEQHFDAMVQDLLERYATAQQARLKLPLSPQILYELLEKDYRSNFLKHSVPVAKLHYTFNQALAGDAWYDRELNSEHGIFRWSGPSPVSHLDFALQPPGDMDLRLRFKVMMTLTPQVLDSLTVEIEREVISLTSRSLEEGGWLFEGTIHQSLVQRSQGFIRIYFKLFQTVSPATLSPVVEDARRLGIALNWLEIEPVTDVVAFLSEEEFATTTHDLKIPHLLVIADANDFENYHVGDEAMLEANLNRFRHYLPDVRLTVISAKPAWTARYYQAEAINSFGFRNEQERTGERQRLLAQLTATAFHYSKTGNFLPETSETAQILIGQLAATDGLVISGGGNLCSSWPDHLYERVALIRLARLFHKPVVVLGQTIGPHLEADERLLLQEVLPGADFVGVREKASLALVQALGVSVSNSALQLDDAFWLTPQIPQPLPTALETAKCWNLPLLLITVPPFSQFLDNNGLLKAFAAELNRIAQHTGARLVLVPHLIQQADNVRLSDVAIHDRLAEFLDTTVPLTVLPLLTASQVKWLTSQADLVISMRYHPVVFGLAAGVPAFGVYTDTYTKTKIQGALAHAELENWSLPLELALSGALVDGILELWEKREIIRQHLQSFNQEWWYATENHWSKICTMLNYPFTPGAAQSDSNIIEFNKVKPQELQGSLEPTGNWREAARLFEKQIASAAYKPGV